MFAEQGGILTFFMLFGGFFFASMSYSDEHERFVFHYFNK